MSENDIVTAVLTPTYSDWETEPPSGHNPLGHNPLCNDTVGPNPLGQNSPAVTTPSLRDAAASEFSLFYLSRQRFQFL